MEGKAKYRQQRRQDERSDFRRDMDLKRKFLKDVREGRYDRRFHLKGVQI